MLITKIKYKVRKFLPSALIRLLQRVKNLTVSEISSADIFIDNIVNKKGIEIGGPSVIFRTALPIYQKISDLDGVNFSPETLWEGQIKPGLTYNFTANKVGYQYISDGTKLSEIGDGIYDFLISSNCLEHIANPIKALNEWRRVIKDKGNLILVLPNKLSNFDHKRPITSIDHLINDFQSLMTEDDLSHLDEILELHDLTMDPAAGSFDNFRNRSLNNFNNRTLHHHVFDLDLMKKLVEFAGFVVIQMDETDKDLFILARKN